MRLFIQTGLASLVMGLLLFWFMGPATDWQGSSALQRAMQLAGLVGLGGGAYFLILWVTGWRFASLRKPR
jgi:peptidoglycan biosynthesis protein MviN/MurJ (putative lipid II flippase)